ncbi:MAG: TldD/PmbA family protein, partial [Gemmatimonadaceae bacterium]
MAQSRREFLRSTSAALAAAGLAACSSASHTEAPSPPSPATSPEAGDASFKELALRALDAARSAGASYADVRISRNRNQALVTREQRVQAITDSETFGFGVRVLVGGAWGFAASRDLTRDEVTRVARQAADQARANRAAMVRPVQLAPVTPVPNGTWRSPAEIDPFDVSVEDKVQLLLAANAAALKVQGARFVNSSMFFLREEKTFASTDGSMIVQTIYRSQPNVTITAVAPDFSDFQSRQSTDVQPMGRGYEHVVNARLVENAPRWAEEAVQKLSAKPVDVGRYDLVLHPTHLWLTIHESIGHPTELDRAMGYEANYAGTSFIAPPQQFLGKFKYGPEFFNVQGDRSQPGSLSAVGWDDEGVKPDDFLIVKNGVFNDYQT